MAQLNRTKADFENVSSFVRRSESNSTALDLVYQAAELFNDIEQRAYDTEARSKAICETAAEKIRLAEARANSAEQSRREMITEVEAKLQAASRALMQAGVQISAAEDKATAAEVRVQLAEAKAREAVEALALVEGAIRKQLLRKDSSSSENWRDCLSHVAVRQERP
jgi:L-lactate utilization protein LutB